SSQGIQWLTVCWSKCAKRPRSTRYASAMNAAPATRATTTRSASRITRRVIARRAAGRRRACSVVGEPERSPHAGDTAERPEEERLEPERGGAPGGGEVTACRQADERADAHHRPHRVLRRQVAGAVGSLGRVARRAIATAF